MAPRRDIFGAMLGRVFQKWVALSMSPSLGGLRRRASQRKGPLSLLHPLPRVSYPLHMMVMEGEAIVKMG